VWFGGVLGAVLTISLSGAALPAAPTAGPSSGRFIVAARSAADRAALRAEVEGAGGTIVRELDQLRSFVVSGPSTLRRRLAASVFAAGIASDRINRVVEPSNAADFLSAAGGQTMAASARIHHRAKPDPAFSLQGLLWNVKRVHAPEAWRQTLGVPSVLVGIADTGIDFTHADLASRIVDVVDFTTAEDPPLCQSLFGIGDADLANAFPPGPLQGDWNGHGTHVAGIVAAALDRQGLNGLAPGVRLVSLKIAQWCEAAYDSTVLAAILYAADHGIDVINISFGSYRDLADPDDRLVYGQYAAAVAYANARGTAVVAAAGNDHVRVGYGGRVLSRGSITTPGSAVRDLFGLFQVPGGLAGVLNVSATNNVNNRAELGCPAGSTGSPDDEFAIAECKPKSDRHQPFGDQRNQLAYYSNYGPRVDIAAPGGARKFNLPGYDRGGTPGWPWTDEEGSNAWEVFSTSSNWAVSVPCFLIESAGFLPDQCYSSLQGTSQSAPHAAAALALIASARPKLRHKPATLARELVENARRLHGNRTPGLSASDRSPGDLSGIPCTTGYCHLGGVAIADDEAYGAGLVDIDKAVRDKDGKSHHDHHHHDHGHDHDHDGDDHRRH
jgi:subtilisin family serine protease